ncbi:hypothetical protein WK78_26395 [Burkholderia cepacia]|uniref:H-NS histone family protein n=1 Tax=Burkholderia cepacia TaxID=292 RepID=UPI00075BE875|nr:H-NS histone family protein [Burkholderia cepacia]KVV20842.1 hypothetical protein WK78_26395 [Burkholderia cepacia]
MANYKQLLEQRAKLDEQIEALREQEQAMVIEEIRQKMSDYEITVDMLVAKRTRKSTAPATAKYRDPKSGKEWSGRGKMPNWLKEASNPEAFLIKQ